MIDRRPQRDAAEQRLISVSEACTRLGLKRTKLSELLLGGKIDSAKIAGRRLVSAASLDAFIDAAIAENARSIQQ